ncbi:MAG: TetR/AcrR family transcriptional regulator, partial [Lachnospiraceae bacterium]|nr:TetR/AcrR family transcriptional regulator [Lachnospiraceae bacterium]
LKRRKNMARTTERAIIDCTIKLAEKKSLKKITVKNIADNCGITRNTFYYYFHDIYDVMEAFVDEKMDELNEANKDDPYKTVFGLIEFSVSHRKVFINLYRSLEHDQMSNFIIKRLRRILVRAINEASGDYALPKQDFDIILAFYEEALSGIMIRWIKDEKSIITPERIRQNVYRQQVLFTNQVNTCIENSKNNPLN